jgi:hypothetical protein
MITKGVKDKDISGYPIVREYKYRSWSINR